MSFYAIDSYDRRNDHSWYKTAAASAVTASALNKPFAVELTSTTSMAPSAGDGKVLGMSAIAVGPNASQTMIARYSENSTKKINWLKGLDVAMKNQVTDQYSYQERSEQIKLRSYIEKQHQDIELRKKLGIDNTKMIETIQSF